MKRILSIALCIILALSLCSCGKPAEKSPEPIEGRWLYRAHAFIQVLTITDDTIVREYMDYEPENITYTTNSITQDGETKIYSLAVTEAELTYDTEIRVTGDKLLWETFEYRRLAEDEEVNFDFTDEEINDMFFGGSEIVDVTGENDPPAEIPDSVKDAEKDEPAPEVTVTPDTNPLVGLWRHTNDKFVLDFEFTADGKKHEAYDGESDGYTTYKITSVTENEDGTTTVQIDENDEGMLLPIKIVLKGDTLNYGEDEFIFIKVK